PPREDVTREQRVIEAEELPLVEVDRVVLVAHVLEELRVALPLDLEEHELADVVEEATGEELVRGQAEVDAEVPAEPTDDRGVLEDPARLHAGMVDHVEDGRGGGELVQLLSADERSGVAHGRARC